jgi:hypothetical protein
MVLLRSTSFFFFFLSNKKRRIEREKQRERITPTSWSVVRYVVQGEVDKRME